MGMPIDVVNVDIGGSVGTLKKLGLSSQTHLGMAFEIQLIEKFIREKSPWALIRWFYSIFPSLCPAEIKLANFKLEKINESLFIVSTNAVVPTDEKVDQIIKTIFKTVSETDPQSGKSVLIIALNEIGEFDFPRIPLKNLEKIVYCLITLFNKTGTPEIKFSVVFLLRKIHKHQPGILEIDSKLVPLYREIVVHCEDPDTCECAYKGLTDMGRYDLQERMRALSLFIQDKFGVISFSTIAQTINAVKCL